MKSLKLKPIILLISLCAALPLAGCSTFSGDDDTGPSTFSSPTAVESMPSQISTSEKVVIVDPRIHAFGAYDESGNLIRSGQASAGRDWCPDLGRPCHTSVGTFRFYSLGAPECKSTLFPLGRGGAPMPYCMYFHENQALHGVPDSEVGDANLSHGCVRVHVDDAEWLRYNFVNNGTKIIVKPY